MKESTLWLLGKILSLTGIILALYVLWERFFTPAFQPCNVNSFITCSAIVSGPVSITLGLPTALYGLTGYVIILSAAILRKKRLFFVTAVLGLLFCLWIGYQEFFLLHVICPVCLLCELDMLLLFVLGVFLQKKK